MSPEPVAGVAAATSTAWIALGSNIGNRRAALDMLHARLGAGGLTVADASPQIITRAVGVVEQRDFLNQVVRVEAAAPLPARAWLQRCKAAEWAAGRRHTYRFGPRRADADILLLGPRGALRVTDHDDIAVPHRALGERPFLCALLAAIDPSLQHPDGWLVASRSGRYAPRTSTLLAIAPTGA